MSRLSYLLTLTPRETWRLVRLRAPVLKRGPAWTAAELLSSTKHGRGIRFAELMLRQEAVVRRHMPWAPLDFHDKRVVEVGCGPLAGYGPLAVFCGARSFESAEPEWDGSLFHSEEIAAKYLRTFHADLVGLYGPLMDFPTFRRMLRERIHVATVGFESAPIHGPVDVVVSQSVLEHVFPLEATIAKLAAIQSPSTRFLHLVDFGNHYPTNNPFEGLYEQPPETYIARRGRAINCLRASDVTALFERYKIPARVIVSRMARDDYSGTVHPWWSEKYADESLFTQLVLIAGPDEGPVST
jgi:hypothetical protein